MELENQNPRARKLKCSNTSLYNACMPLAIHHKMIQIPISFLEERVEIARRKASGDNLTWILGTSMNEFGQGQLRVVSKMKVVVLTIWGQGWDRAKLSKMKNTRVWR